MKADQSQQKIDPNSKHSCQKSKLSAHKSLGNTSIVFTQISWTEEKLRNQCYKASHY